MMAIRSASNPLRRSLRSTRRAFTLVELLVVIAIIGILMAILIPTLNSIRAASRATACKNNLRQVAFSVRAYTESRDGILPAQWQTDRSEPWMNFSWTVDVLPYLDQQNLRDSFDLELEPLSMPNLRFAKVNVPIFECPATPGSPRQAFLGGSAAENIATAVATRDYVAIHQITLNGMGQRGVWNGSAKIESFDPEFDSMGQVPPGDHQFVNSYDPTVRTIRGSLVRVPDGLSSTALLVEQAGRPDTYRRGMMEGPSSRAEGAWATCDFSFFNGERINASNIGSPYSFHRSVTVAMCDGSVHAWSEEMDPAIMAALLSSDGKELISAEDWK